MEIKIIKMGINGEGIGYIDRVPVFVKGALLDEVVNVEKLEFHERYYTASVKSFAKKSKDRVEPKCAIQKRCGGCSLMDMKMVAQLRYKEDTLKQSLIKYAQLDSHLVKPIKASEDYYYYRNQFKFPVKTLHGKLVSGLYEEGSNRLTYIDRCIIHEKPLEEMRIKIMAVLNEHGIRDYYERLQIGLRYIILRGFNGQFQLTLVTGDSKLPPACIEDLAKLKGLVSIFQNVNTDERAITSENYSILHGAKTIELRLMNKVFRVSPAAFFQLNYKQACNLYQYVIDLIQPCNYVVEAYSGIGAMSILASDKAQKIDGVEINKQAVKNANVNAKFNHVNDKVNFVCDDAGRFMQNVKQRIDYLLVDPPRRGLDERMIDNILDAKPKNIIYVSCNPSTLGKNINELAYEYQVESIQPFDMFPNTPHVESVVLMSRIK